MEDQLIHDLLRDDSMESFLSWDGYYKMREMDAEREYRRTQREERDGRWDDVVGGGD